jgi:hypothetical protein
LGLRTSAVGHPCAVMTDSLEGTAREGEDQPELVEQHDEDEQHVRAPQPGSTPAPSESPYDDTIPRERPDPDQ